MSNLTSPPFDDSNRSELAERLSHLSTDEGEIDELLKSFPPYSTSGSQDPNPSDIEGPSDISEIHKVLDKSGAGQAYFESFRKGVLGLQTGCSPSYYMIRELPCANVQVAQDWACPNRGMSTCSSCKIVAYCSKASLSFALLLVHF